ncbi:MAG: MFS transporter [Flavobacteriales bacterium]|nr:MAG: MFS transporter [Flavobacteriales bacterium]
MGAISRALRFYIGSFSGFSREIWLLTLITFVNRAGTMVVPFMSLYLTKDMGLSLEQVGWIMSCFGAGSVVGSWLGGKLTDKLGFYDVMIGALATSGLAFFGLQHVHGFVPFCIGVFVLMVLSDGFRPALFVAIRNYAKPEDRTRAVTLIRLAINLGFSLGPAIGGFIIAAWSYAGLFWIDGLTCLAAAALLWGGLRRKQAKRDGHAARTGANGSPYADRPYLFFLLTVVFITIPFLQYFSSVPLFYSDVHHLSEEYIGLLLGSNGLLIFLTEMPLVRYCEDRRIGLHAILRTSVVLFVFSFLVLNWFPNIAFLWVGMVFMTVGEMLNFPFMNRFANERADRGQPGAYMALYTMSWSAAHIIGHTLGLQLVDRFGYSATWYLFGGMLVVGLGLLFALERMLARER